MVGGNEHINLPDPAQVERDGELQRIEGAKAFYHTVLIQESSCAVKLAFVDRSDKEALACNIGAESAPGDLQRLFIDLRSPGLDGQHGLQFDNREVRDQGPRPCLLEYAVHVFGAALLVVAFRQRAGVEEVVWQSALLPESDDGVGKGT